MNVLLFAGLAGVVQSVTPDRWLPSSIVSWKRGYRSWQTAGLSAFLAIAHLIMGFGLYKVLVSTGTYRFLSQKGFGLFAGAVLFVGLAIRYYSFGRVKEIVLSSNKGALPIGLLLQLVGPSEVLALVLIRAKSGPLLSVFGAYSVGALSAMVLLSLFGRELWNKPFWLPRGLQIADQSTAAMTILTGIGLTLLSAARFL